MCLFTSALRASVNKSHIPSLPQNNLYIFADYNHNYNQRPFTMVINRGKQALALCNYYQHI
jgi:hypothetical protein